MRVPDQVSTAAGQAVAITGAALRFPGASDPAAFHELTVAGRRMFREFGRHAGGGRRPGPGSAGRPTPPDGQPLLAALLDDFDSAAVAGGVWPDATVTGQVIAAGTAAAALADLPAAGRAIAPGRIGVFLAGLPEREAADVTQWVRDQLAIRGGAEPGADRGRLVAESAPARPAPGVQLCSLRAVAAACEALNAGEFDLVLAGGVTRHASAWPSPGPASGPVPGQVRVYDASPTGTLPGEGCGVVALMRAGDARTLGVPAYAEIAGWGHAGLSAGRQAVSEAYRRAGIDPADIQFIEGHGAATADDDLAELSALFEVLGPPAGGAAGRCALGAVSANIGDTRSAAGIAALLKTVFAMTADTIPPATGCVRPHRLLCGEKTPFRLPAAPEQWPQTPVQLAAVNTLGTAARPGAARSGPVHVVLRRERDLAHRPGRRRKPSPLVPAAGNSPR